MKAIQSVISLLLAVTVLMPSLTWSFNGVNYQTGQIQATQVMVNGHVLSLPKKHAQLINQFRGQGKTVICIQDLHCHHEVQANIAAIIDYLVKQEKLKLIGVEGYGGGYQLIFPE